MAKVGIIGVGNIGLGVAESLLKKGFTLTAYDKRKEPLEVLTQKGAKIATSSREVGEKSDQVIILVFDGSQAKEVLSGDNGLLAGMKQGGTVILASSIFASQAQEIARMVEQKEINIVDCPVSGSIVRAREGALTLMIAAKKELFDKCQPLFQAIGRDIFHVGEQVGMGQVAKACQLALAGTISAATAEALTLGVKAGLKPEVLYGVISTSTVGCLQFNHWAKMMMERNFRTGPKLTTLLKDLTVVVQTGKDYDVPLFTAATALEVVELAKSVAPDDDIAAIVKGLEKITGVEVRKSTENPER
jgi:3-hydroxyisobutyrate dehydrogenase-like beta-hydroxyacid dehydrogenase